MSVEITQETPAHPRDWSGGIDRYLEQHQIVCRKVTPLSGGLSGWVWRLDGYDDDDGSHGRGAGEPVILKCADGMAKLAPVPLAAERLQLETKALRSPAVAEASRQVPSVGVPRVLKETRRGDPAAVGARLGSWLARLHLAGRRADRDDGWAPHNDGVATFTAPGGLEEQAVRAAIGKAGRGETQIRRAVDVLRRPPPVPTLTPWDFRPMNTLVRVREEQQPVPEELTIVDWEFSHFGDPVYDVRLWAAEAMVLEAQCGKGDGGGEEEDDDRERGGVLLSSFLRAYRIGTGDAIVDDTFVCKVAVAMGAFLLLFMPAPFWDCVEADREPWVKVALDYVNAGAEGDMAWLRQSRLGPLLMKP
ncbi:hypothetical protein PG991_008112 [Apiospora marii]|uniref:Aminoglycoside phosphotransferase domain-containing protein n=1 Tax=Apiospora marii TaxID=335849 RepID=A0ABR1RVS5_9PEZI